MLVINNKIIIAHMKKCGGTSVCKGMIENLPAHSVEYWGYTPEGEDKSARSRRRGGVWKHSPVAEILDKLPGERNNFTVYLISLRPWWDRVGSFYFHAKRYNKRTGTKYAWAENMSFSDYIRSPYMEEVEHLDRFCQGRDGAVLPDYFVSYDGLAGWYRERMAEFGVRDAELPEYNRGRAKFADGYRALYTPGDFAYLEEKFAGETALAARLAPSGCGQLALSAA
ncbi:hypothetical protein [Cribrihabitans pelagius]|uniref:hypothetical protein n=1 Tax=Cribrihabitans pelagius TaxID=1765746 RepID=UPI003B58D26F